MNLLHEETNWENQDNREEVQEEAWAYMACKDLEEVIISQGPTFVIDVIEENLLEMLFECYSNRKSSLK